MPLSAEFRARVEAYAQKARQAKDPEVRQQYAAIAARCRELSRDNPDILIAVPLDPNRPEYSSEASATRRRRENQ